MSAIDDTYGGTYGTPAFVPFSEWGEMKIEILWGVSNSGKSHDANKKKGKYARVAVVEEMTWKHCSPEEWLLRHTVNRTWDAHAGDRFAIIIVVSDTNPTTWWPNASHESRWKFFRYVTYIRHYSTPFTGIKK